MPIDSKHKLYVEAEKRTKKSEAIREGEEYVHAAGKQFLPVPSGMSDALQKREDGSKYNEYDNFVERAPFFNATARTISGMSGLVSEKAPKIENSDSMQPFFDDCTMAGDSFKSYVECVLDETFYFGRGGTLIEYPVVKGKRTKAQADELNLRTKLVYYNSLSIINWSYTVINNKKVFDMVILEESYSVGKESKKLDGDKVIITRDKYDRENKIRYRELMLNEEGNYVQRIWTDDNGKWSITDEFFPKIKGRFLKHIPFVMHNQKLIGSGKIKSPLLDLMNLNVKHYQRSADHEHSLHHVCNPTRYLFGIDKTELPTGAGATALWWSEQKDVSAGVIEFSGNGLADSKEQLDKYETQMAFLGARLLIPDSGGNQMTATGEKIKLGSELSTLGRIVVSLNEDIKTILGIVDEWQSETSESVFEYPTDILPSVLTIQDALGFMQLWLQGATSKETLFNNLKKAGLYDEEENFKDEEDKIKTENPVEEVDEDEDEDEED